MPHQSYRRSILYTMKIYKLQNQALLLTEKGAFLSPELKSWAELINRSDLYQYLESMSEQWTPAGDDFLAEQDRFDPPVDSYQEVWAAGVTYLRSKEARMEESEQSGGDRFYDLVYDAPRPELFFKAIGHRVKGHGSEIGIRSDSPWNVPEPELTLFMTSKQEIVAYTIGNDVSSRSIEGENPLYLPQAKMYDSSAAVGPCLYIPKEPISPDTIIDIRILRNEDVMYKDSIRIDQMKRTHKELVSYLFRSHTFEEGVFLMTGTCLIPENDFTLKEKDRVEISITGIGTLINQVKTV